MSANTNNYKSISLIGSAAITCTSDILPPSCDSEDTMLFNFSRTSDKDSTVGKNCLES